MQILIVIRRFLVSFEWDVQPTTTATIGFILAKTGVKKRECDYVTIVLLSTLTVAPLHKCCGTNAGKEAYAQYQDPEVKRAKRSSDTVTSIFLCFSHCYTTQAY